MNDQEKAHWLTRLLALFKENPDAELVLLADDQIMLSYGPGLDDEFEIGTRRKLNIDALEASIKMLSGEC